MSAQVPVSIGVILAGILLAGAMALQGCEPYGAVAPAGVDTVSVALPSQFGDGSAQLFLYRIKSRATGERQGIGREFRIEERRQVRAVLELSGVTPGEELLIHLMWLNPDGKEVYTKETWIGRADWRDGARQDSLRAKRVLLEPQAGIVEVESRYGVSPARFDEELHKPEEKRTFEAGTWTLRAYLYRKLLLQSSFELLPPE